ncbi:MAG: DNA cytosine methyltransferase [Patescibacteria group bacterium]
MKLISLFTGAGGLDLGFERAGFEVVWANEFDEKIWETYRQNFPKAILDTRSISEIPSAEIPDAVGIIGGPPCQSWSEAGALRGEEDERGKLFFEFARVLRDKRPLFFLAENVSGLLFKRHAGSVQKILSRFKRIGYGVSYALLNAKYYGVPQDRERVIFVGYHKDMGKKFDFPAKWEKMPTLKDAIWDLRKSAKPASEKNRTNGDGLNVPNHEFMNGGFSPIYMSRNRVRGWNEQSYTIQAGGRHAPLHPQANKMVFIEDNKFIFDPKSPSIYRRLTVRECARVQTFPDDFILAYNSVADGYKMIGNAVPVKLAEAIALKIKKDLTAYFHGRQIHQGEEELDNVAHKVLQHQA